MLLLPIWAKFKSITTYLKSTQLETSFGRTEVERYGILGNSYDNYFREHAQVITPRGSVILRFSSKKRVVIHSPVNPLYFDIALCTRVQGKIARERRCHNFDLALVPSHGACQGISTPASPAARNTQIVQRGTSLGG